MSFLDNLENSLKSLESREESQQQTQDDRRKQEAERERAQAAAPFAEQLKAGPFTAGLLDQAAALGHSCRTKVHIAWIGTTLRLEARGRKLELRPTGEGVFAVYFENNEEVSRPEKVDMGGDPTGLARALLAL